MKIYKWAEGARSTIVSAQEVGEELKRIEDESGMLIPRDIVAGAKPKRSVLHPVFEWDDSIAGLRYREDQARHLIRSVRVVIWHQGDERPRRAFVNVIENDRQGYIATARAMSDEGLKDQVIRQAWDQFEALRLRYEDLKALGDIYKAIGKAGERLGYGNREKRVEAIGK